MALTEWLNRIRRRWSHFRLRSIKVFCFHQVSEEYDPLIMWHCDWTQIEQFKKNILFLKDQFVFISLQEAYERIKRDSFRFRRFAVLTADDGYHSVLNILPWLEEQKIPVTLFINTRYLDKQSWSAINEEQAKRNNSQVDMLNDVCPNLYVSQEELFKLDSPLVSIGLHGHEHIDACKQTNDGFRKNVEDCKAILSCHPRYVPFFAYTWGHHTSYMDGVIKELGLIPVLMNGESNYNNSDHISRICIDGLHMY